MAEPLRLLSLDGGGVRGLSTIKILKHMMTMISNERGREVHPWEVFDMMGGTSTGGLLAIMLGRLRMSVDECEEAYLDLSRNIFKSRRTEPNIFGRGSDFLQANGKFSTEELEAAIKEIVRSKRNTEDTLLREDSAPPCRVFVCAATASTSTHTNLRSYKTRSLPDFNSEKCTIWEACRATSAATGFFEPITIGSCGQRFIDGAITYNNPVQLVYNEAKDIFGQSRADNAILVSIGTGRGPLKPFQGNLKNIVEAMKKLITDSQKAHDDFSNNHHSMVDRNLFFRFNVYPGLEDVGLHEYAQVGKIEGATKDYLQNGDTRRVFNRCIRMLLLEPQGSTVNLRSPELSDTTRTPLTPTLSGSRDEPEFQECPIPSLEPTRTISAAPTSADERVAHLTRAQYSDSSGFLDAMDEGRALMDQQDLRRAKEHFSRILTDLHAHPSEPAQLLRVYRALTIVELTMTFGKISFDDKKHRLQTAIFYNDKACQLARSFVTDRGELALAKLQRAIVNGRMAQLEAKQGNGVDEVAKNWKATALRHTNSALDELRWSNHEGFEDSQRWAHEWLRSFGFAPPYNSP